MICPHVVTSMNITRMIFDLEQGLRIDFSSWLMLGIAGMYVTGTLKLDNVQSPYSDLNTIPGKYFVCLSDVAKNVFDIAFIENEKKNICLLDASPIIRSNDNPYTSRNYHKMTTLEDFARELDGYQESTESS